MAIQRAGIIPYFINDLGEIEMLFMKPSNPKYGGPDFQIAKGKVEFGEEIIDTAIRETAEELGLKLSNTKTSPVFLGTFLGAINIFIVEVIDKDDFDPWDFETSESKWLTVSEFYIIGRDLHFHIVEEAHHVISCNDE